VDADKILKNDILSSDATTKSFSCFISQLNQRVFGSKEERKCSVCLPVEWNMKLKAQFCSKTFVLE
jgi:hypothetical protein